MKIIFKCLFILLCGSLNGKIHPYKTPIIKYLRPIELTQAESGLPPIDCIYVINLDERPEKWERMQQILPEQGLFANRASGINGWKLTQENKEDLFGTYPIRLKDGAIGCLLSHVSVIQDAYQRGFDLIWIMEDDVEFIEDIKQIPDLIAELTQIDPDWDVLYTDLDSKTFRGKYLRSFKVDFRPDQASCFVTTRRKQLTKNLMRLGLRYGNHSYIVSKSGITKILNYFTHVFFWAPYDKEIHYIPSIKEYSVTADIVSNFYRSRISDTNRSPNRN